MNELRGRLSKRDYSLLAAGWDAAIKSLCYDDGSPLDIVANDNPYAKMRDQEQALEGGPA